MSNIKFDPNSPGNKNILRNLREKYPQLNRVPDIPLLERYNDWMEPEDDAMVEYLIEGYEG